jgi:hypothetical protein
MIMVMIKTKIWMEVQLVINEPWSTFVFWQPIPTEQLPIFAMMRGVDNVKTDNTRKEEVYETK